MAPNNETREGLLDTDISFDMERLFDQYNFDHIPMEKRLSLFKQRNLAHVKFYKAAVKIFGGPSRRTRSHVAPPMETPLRHRLGIYLNLPESPPAISFNGQLKSLPGHEEGKEEVAVQKNEKTTSYKQLITERKKLRHDLDNLMPNEAYMARKINKSELEIRVQAQYQANHHHHQEPEVSLLAENVQFGNPRPDMLPMVATPLHGLQILDKFLSLNHMTLRDLFVQSDKQNNWTLSRQEFFTALMQAEITLSEAEMDAMFVVLDTDLDGKLSYQELNKGLQLWRKQRGITNSQIEEESAKYTGFENTSGGQEKGLTMSGPESSECILEIHRKGSRDYASIPCTQYQMPNKHAAFDELPGMIKVGYKPIDDHCSESTLGGQTADSVNHFRRVKLKEYFDIRKLFQERGLPFTEKVLDRVILYPGDQPTSELKENLPVDPLSEPKYPSAKMKFVRGNANRQTRYQNHGFPVTAPGFDSAKSSNLKGDFGGVRSYNSKRSPHRKTLESGQISGQVKKSSAYLSVHDVYPAESSAKPRARKVNLSSGKALVSRKVDNWMTFEEYSKYTQHLTNRFRHLRTKSNPNAAWPGYLIHKLRLYMDGDVTFTDGQGHALENRGSRVYEGLGTGTYNGKGNSIFLNTAQPKRAYPGYNNDLRTWPVGENGVRFANIDEHRVVK